MKNAFRSASSIHHKKVLVLVLVLKKVLITSLVQNVVNLSLALGLSSLKILSKSVQIFGLFCSLLTYRKTDRQTDSKECVILSVLRYNYILTRAIVNS